MAAASSGLSGWRHSERQVVLRSFQTAELQGMKSLSQLLAEASKAAPRVANVFLWQTWLLRLLGSLGSVWLYWAVNEAGVTDSLAPPLLGASPGLLWDGNGRALVRLLPDDMCWRRFRLPVMVQCNYGRSMSMVCRWHQGRRSGGPTLKNTRQCWVHRICTILWNV